MKCRRDLWMKALDLARHSSERKATLPACSQVLVEAKDGRLTLTTQDLERFQRIRLPADGVLKAGVYDLQTLVQISKAPKRSNGENMHLTTDDSVLRLGIAERQFELHQEGRPADMPKFPELQGEAAIRAWDSKQFLEALDYVLPAASQDETRFHLCSVALRCNAMVTTDGHRCHIVNGIESFPDECLIHPATGVAISDAVKKTEADWVMARRSGCWAEFSIEGPVLDVHMIAKVIEAKFPPHDKIVANHENGITVDAATLREAADTAAKVIKAKGKTSTVPVELVINGDLRVTSRAGSTEVITLAEKAPHDHHCGLFGSYLVDSLRGARGNIVIGYGTPMEVVEIRDGCRLALVMPWRVD